MRTQRFLSSMVLRFRPLAAFVVLALSVGLAAAQEKKDDEKPGPAAKEKKIPPPEDVVVRTADGVVVNLTYYASNKGKEAVPVVLLHARKGSRKDFKDLALFLQAQGHAVVVPDLRGHGESTTGYDQYKRRFELKEASFRKSDFEAMVKLDMIMVKEFLWEKNNAGELNLNRLCLGGAEMGASVAVEFALYDAVGYMQGNPPGSPMYGPLQVGRFVKALVLLSPEWSYQGMVVNGPLGNAFVARDIAALILVGGETSKNCKEAERIHALFEKHHPEPTTGSPEEKLAKKTLFFGALKTGLQGIKLLSDKNLNVEKHVARFIDLRLVRSDEAKLVGWKELKKPHQ